jgi:hypothetical protein
VTARDYDWQDKAACKGSAPMWDLDTYPFDPNAPLMAQLAQPAIVCSRCPVRDACEAWADGQLADDQAMDCVAAGFIYRNTSNGKSKKRVEWKECALCLSVMYNRGNKFCSPECGVAGRVSA